MTFTTYKEVRKNVKTGDLFFTTSQAFVSKAIRFVTGGEVSHVGMFLVIEGRVFAVESLEGKGCRMSLASVRFENVPLVVKHNNFDLKERKRLTKRILADVGRIEYDWLGALIAPFVTLDNSKHFCSEWVTSVLGLDLKLKRGIYPSDLL